MTLNSQLIIREGEPGDLAQITAIYRDAVLNGTGSFEIDPPDEGEMTSRYRRITGQGYPFLVACDGAAVVGYAYAFAYRDRPAYRFTVEDSVYVRSGLQGRGVGAALLARLIENAEDRGYRQMVAVIGDSTNAASIRLHRKAGFRPVGTLESVGWKHERWLDVVLMQRTLGSGSAGEPADARRALPTS